MLSETLSGIDLANFYRAPLFQGEAKRNVSDWTTHLEARYAQGSTKKSWDTNEVETHLFNMYGPFDLRKLADNVEDLDSKPNTKAYAEGEIPTLYDGKLKFRGKFEIDELDITLQQNLFWGLYLQAHIPIRKLKISEIDYCASVTTNIEHEKLVNFVDNDLDDILAEFCIEPLKSNFERTQVADVLVSLGWNGHCEFPDSKLSALRGFLQAGIIFPSGSRKDINKVFSIPTGYNKNWGAHVRGNIHATLWKKLVLGANAGASIFWRQTHDQRLATSIEQNGMILLEKGRATTDLGTLWDVTVYAKAEHLVGGLSALAGYSYTQQEDSTLLLRDENPLKTALANSDIKNKDEVINSSKHTQQWYQHTLHFYAEYDFGAHGKIFGGPAFRISYDYPVIAKHTFNTDMFGGTASVAIDWCW
jgi:hypothetical protein